MLLSLSQRGGNLLWFPYDFIHCPSIFNQLSLFQSCFPASQWGKRKAPHHHCLVKQCRVQRMTSQTQPKPMLIWVRKPFQSLEWGNYCQNVEMLCKDTPAGLILVGGKRSAKSFSWRMIQVLSALCIKLMAVACRITYKTKSGTIATGCCSLQGRKCLVRCSHSPYMRNSTTEQISAICNMKTKCACQMWAPDWLLCTTVTRI